MRRFPRSGTSSVTSTLAAFTAATAAAVLLNLHQSQSDTAFDGKTSAPLPTHRTIAVCRPEPFFKEYRLTLSTLPYWRRCFRNRAAAWGLLVGDRANFAIKTDREAFVHREQAHSTYLALRPYNPSLRQLDFAVVTPFRQWSAFKTRACEMKLHRTHHGHVIAGFLRLLD